MVALKEKLFNDFVASKKLAKHKFSSDENNGNGNNGDNKVEKSAKKMEKK